MILSISNKFLSAKISSKGAELNSLIKDNREYIWQADPAFWAKHAPILFPIVGTLKQDTYKYEDKEYQLTRHGFARDHEFEIKESSAESVTFSLKSSENTIKVYPFQFELLITYALQENKLVVNYSVKNLSDSILPFSIGGHPAFSLPEKFEGYTLELKNDSEITSYYLKKDLLSDDYQTINLKNNQLHLDYQLFKDDALIIKSLDSKEITVAENNKSLFTFEFNDFPNFGIWTKQDAPFICLEPWFGYSDKLDSTQRILEKEGIILLEKDNSFEASFSVLIF